MDLTPSSIAVEMRDAREDFHRLVDEATTADLRMRSDGTRWTNDQLLFHMLLGYMVVRALLWLVHGFSSLPSSYSHAFAHGLNAAARPFHVLNYLGSLGGARVLGHGGMERVMDNVTDSPFFSDYMTVQDLLHYATQHYQHHRRQLTLSNAHND